MCVFSIVFLIIMNPMMIAMPFYNKKYVVQILPVSKTNYHLGLIIKHNRGFQLAQLVKSLMVE